MLKYIQCHVSCLHFKIYVFFLCFWHQVASVPSSKQNKNHDNLVAKVIPVGSGKGKASKDQDRLCDTLHYEYSLYTGALVDFPFLPSRPSNFYGFDETVGVRYLVMERLETDLVGHCTAKQGISITEIASWGKQILSGLQMLHNIGFLFIDVKPENFMIKGLRLYFIDCTYGIHSISP